MSPCSDERPGDRERQDHMREGAGLLCEWFTALEKMEAAHLLPVKMQKWWIEHKALDQKYREDA